MILHLWFALRAGFQSCSVYPVEILGTPLVEVRGIEPLSEPIRKVTYPQKRMPPGGFEPPTLALQKPCTTAVL